MILAPTSATNSRRLILCPRCRHLLKVGFCWRRPSGSDPRAAKATYPAQRAAVLVSLLVKGSHGGDQETRSYPCGGCSRIQQACRCRRGPPPSPGYSSFWNGSGPTCRAAHRAERPAQSEARPRASWYATMCFTAPAGSVCPSSLCSVRTSRSRSGAVQVAEVAVATVAEVFPRRLENFTKMLA